MNVDRWKGTKGENLNLVRQIKLTFRETPVAAIFYAITYESKTLNLIHSTK